MGACISRAEINEHMLNSLNTEYQRRLIEWSATTVSRYKTAWAGQLLNHMDDYGNNALRGFISKKCEERFPDTHPIDLLQALSVEAGERNLTVPDDIPSFIQLDHPQLFEETV